MAARGLSDKEIKHRIITIFATLVADLDPDQMSDYLIQGFVITVVQWQEILHRQLTKQGRCRALLNHLLTTENPKASNVFVNTLERNTQWQWILDKFNQQERLDETESNESCNLRLDSDRKLEEAKLKWVEEKEEMLETQKHLQKQVEELQENVEKLSVFCDDAVVFNDLETDTPKNPEIVSNSRSCSDKSAGRLYVGGKIHLKLVYVSSLHQLLATVVECKGLKAVDKKMQHSNPYVKIYVLPDDAKVTKRKTAVKYNTLNPGYLEAFKFHLPSSDVTYTLWISVWHKFKWRRNKCLGDVFIPIDEGLEKKTDDWYCLSKKKLP